MSKSRLPIVGLLTMALGCGGLLAGRLATAQETPVRLRAAIERVEGRQLTLESRDGQKLALTLTPEATITAVVPADLSAIREGTYIGTAASPGPDGRLQALEVLIFPETMRGTGEGHYPWDLTPGSTMTNATVSAVVTEVNGRALTLAYKGEQGTVLVPPGTPIVALEPGDASLLKPGNHVFLSARKQPDGAFTAERIAVGKDGLVPPM